MTVEVVDNMVVNVIPSILGEPEEATKRQGSDDTIPMIDGLFEEIQDALDSKLAPAAQNPSLLGA
jgi:hypothetical protein